jgi:plasmid stabilization system protein ParE
VRIIFLPEARRDAAWWRHYYRQAFPEGKISAFWRLNKTIGLLRENPYLGRPVPDYPLQQLVIPNTPFKIIYRIRGERLEIVRLWDVRRKPTPGFQETSHI